MSKKKKLKIKRIHLFIILCLIISVIITIVIVNNNSNKGNVTIGTKSGSNARITGSETFKYETDNYKIEGHVTNKGTPSEDVKIFMADYSIANVPFENANTSYTISYVDFYEHNVKNDYPAVDDYAEIEINGKKYKYGVDGLNGQIDLIYINDENSYLFVKINVIDKEATDSAENKYVIGADVLEAEETAGMLSFDITKK